MQSSKVYSEITRKSQEHGESEQEFFKSHDGRRADKDQTKVELCEFRVRVSFSLEFGIL